MHHNILKKPCRWEIYLTWFKQQFSNSFNYGTLFAVALTNRVIWSGGWEIQVGSDFHSYIIMDLHWTSTKLRKALSFPRKISPSFPHLGEAKNYHLTQAVPSNILRSNGSPWIVPSRRIREWQLAMAAHSGPHGKVLSRAKLWTSWKLVGKLISKLRSSTKSFWTLCPLNLTNIKFQYLTLMLKTNSSPCPLY